MMLDDQKWLEWYNRLQTDKVKRAMGLLDPDEGTMGPEDKLQRMYDRREIPTGEPVTVESVRRAMGFKEPEEK